MSGGRREKQKKTCSQTSAKRGRGRIREGGNLRKLVRSRKKLCYRVSKGRRGRKGDNGHSGRSWEVKKEQNSLDNKQSPGNHLGL